jgi:hypothetical protein
MRVAPAPALTRLSSNACGGGCSRFRANLGYLPAADYDPAVDRGRLPVPSVSVPFLMTRIPFGG